MQRVTKQLGRLARRLPRLAVGEARDGFHWEPGERGQLRVW
jgi:hypothetical protein